MTINEQAYNSTANLKGLSAGILRAMQNLALAHLKHAKAMEQATQIINTAFHIVNSFRKKPRFIKKYSRVDQRFANRISAE